MSGHSDAVLTAVFGDGGSSVVTASGDGTARISDVQSGSERHILDRGGPVVTAAFNVGSTLVVTSSPDGRARLWRAEEHPHYLRSLVHDGPVLSATFNRSSGRSASTPVWP